MEDIGVLTPIIARENEPDSRKEQIFPDLILSDTSVIIPVFEDRALTRTSFSPLLPFPDIPAVMIERQPVHIAKVLVAVVTEKWEIHPLAADRTGPVHRIFFLLEQPGKKAGDPITQVHAVGALLRITSSADTNIATIPAAIPGDDFCVVVTATGGEVIAAGFFVVGFAVRERVAVGADGISMRAIDTTSSPADSWTFRKLFSDEGSAGMVPFRVPVTCTCSVDG